MTALRVQFKTPTIPSIRQHFGQWTLLIYLVNLCNVSTREFDDGSGPSAGGIRFDKNVDAQRLSFRKRIGKARDLVASQFPSIGVGEMAIGNKDRELAKK